VKEKQVVLFGVEQKKGRGVVKGLVFLYKITKNPTTSWVFCVLTKSYFISLPLFFRLACVYLFDKYTGIVIKMMLVLGFNIF
tara:strand:+ start:1789 stop:2034 length:246 start_codon:yes stop_codon:yes gene_type:complete